MSTEWFDVIILGGGNAGMGVTVPTREAGLSVALVEGRDLGGTCPNRGCTPKKVLVAAAHALHEIEQAKTHCITVDKPHLDWAALIAREKRIIKGIPDRLERTMVERGVHVLRGDARFAGRNAIELGGRTLEANHIVIASGSKPRALPIPGAELLTTSDDVLSDMALPRDVVFIGGGVIAFEFAHVYARAGATVTILEALPRVLGEMDIDAVHQLSAETMRLGITVQTGAAVHRIEARDGRYRVHFTADGTDRIIEADRVVNGAGRVANVDSLSLDLAGVRLERGRIVVDDHLRSVSNPAVHVCGDALWSSPQLSPIATYEGRIVGRNIVEGPAHKPDYASIPSCVYTIPALATVGLTEAKAREKGHRIKVHTNNMLDWLSARTYAETVAWAKIIVDEASDRVLGAHIVGHAGEELIHIFALAMKHGITGGELADMVYSFPTFSSDIKHMVG
jgi:glutathione reductase (NADPH)